MDKIAALLPVNKMAAYVTGPGTHFKPTHKPSDYDVRDIQPAVRKWDETTGRDLTGVKFGRFTVIGYNSERRGSWVVRCQCGLYEFRRAKAITNPANDRDMCLDCRQTFYVTRGHHINDTRTKQQRINGEKQY